MALSALLLWGRSTTAQITAADRITAARVEFRAMKLDSAAVLLRYAMDSTAAPSRADLVEAWLLLGVVEFYRGNDSATASSFHQALALEPRLEASGLARYD